ncbi:FAD-binding protein [Novosphingobium sp. G106]|uniref:FAD-binding protein n=1 Tax=Novosphingobium sp. G106 TaxID=2849500 RepID=UPI0020C2F98E|nr:FAD-binding protein [Novosphingobium sp. G106]
MSNLEFDETFDFISVGSGGGSMCSALLMRRLGKSVVVLEKTGLIGGTTSRSGGVMWIPNNRFMKEEGVEDSYEKSHDLHGGNRGPVDRCAGYDASQTQSLRY